MSDNTNLLTRRNALKGIAAFAGTSAVGAGTIIHASEPAVAVNHGITIEDTVIETTDGEVSEFGIRDLWFEITYEHIQSDLGVLFRFSGTGSESSLKTARLGVQGSGTETFGYGDAYAEKYNVDLDGATDFLAQNDIFEAPFTADQEWLEGLYLDEDQDQKTVEVVFTTHFESHHEEFPHWTSAGGTFASFDVTVQRVDQDAEMNEGEGDAYGED